MEGEHSHHCTNSAKQSSKREKEIIDKHHLAESDNEILFFLQDCAGVILYTAENATQIALDAIQILGESVVLLSIKISKLTT